MPSVRELFCALFLSATIMCGVVNATERPIPNQAQWAEAKQIVKLPNGIDMAYIDVGNSNGKPPLLVHGYTDTSRAWSNVAPFFKDRRIIAIDLRGHGGTTAPECCYTMMEFSNDVSLFITEMKLGKVDVAGHSLGTMVSQTLAATHPEQVNKLVLLAGSAMGASKTGGWLWDNVMALSDPIDPESKFMNDWFSRPKPLEPPELDTYGKQEAAKIPVRVWRGILLANTMSDLSTIDALIKAPTLIVAGEKDGLISNDKSEALKNAIANSEYHVVKNAGHGLFKEYPKDVAGMVTEFLNK